MGEPPTAPSNDADDAPSSGDDHLANRILLNTISDGVYHLDSDGTIVAVNDALLELTGYDRDTALGKHISHFLDAEDVVRAETAIRTHLIKGDRDSCRLTFPVVTATGDTIPCEVRISAVTVAGEFHGTVGVVREVDDPDMAASIRDAGEHRQAFDALAEASADGIIMLDDNSIVRYANPAVERILGHSPEELVGEPIVTIIPEELRQAHEDAVHRFLETGEKHIDWTYVELPGLHKDGHDVPLAISLNEFDYNGDHYFVGTFRDISKRKAVERELEQQNERLDHFASMLAHELRNPLQTAHMYLDFVAEGDASAINHVETALDQIDEMIDVLLVLARGEDGISDREMIGLAAAAEAVWATTETATAELEIATTQVLYVNPIHLQHVLENLFRNAVEHSDGAVTVRVGTLPNGFYIADDGPEFPRRSARRWSPRATQQPQTEPGSG